MLGPADNIVVVYPTPAEEKDSRFAYSIPCLIVATMAKDHGQVRYIDMTFLEPHRRSIRWVISQIAEIDNPTVLVYLDGVPLHRSSNVESGRCLIRTLRKRLPSVRIIACGPHCMITQQYEDHSDVTIINEPEFSIDCVLDGENGEGCLVKAEDSPKVRILSSIDVLPTPDRSLCPAYQDPKRYPNGKHHLLSSAVINTSRGCFGSCTFCPRKAWNMGKVRYRSLDTVMGEISNLISANVRNIWIDDDNIAVNCERAIELFDKIALINRSRHTGFFISAWGKAPDEFFQHAAAAGIRVISFGVESGSEAVLRYFGKPVDLLSMKKSIEQADRNGIFTVANIIIGAPCETDSDLAATKTLLEEAPVDEANIKILSYVRGAKLWDHAVSEGLLNPSTDIVFADADMKTSNRTLRVLMNQQQELQSWFSSSRKRRARLAAKIRKYGPPYFTRTTEQLRDFGT